MKVRLLCLLLFTVLLSGCVEYSHTVDYFNVKTSPSYKGPPISTPLHIVISDELADSISARDKYSEIELKLTDFRKTIGNNLKQTLDKSFTDVSVSEQAGNNALRLVINTVNPSLHSNSFTVNHKRTINYYLSFNVDFTLYKKGQIVGNWSTTTNNKYYATSTVFYTELLKSGFKDMCEMISDKVLSDATRNKLIASKQ